MDIMIIMPILILTDIIPMGMVILTTDTGITVIPIGTMATVTTGAILVGVITAGAISAEVILEGAILAEVMAVWATAGVVILMEAVVAVMVAVVIDNSVK
jgi:hypothetical protein